MKKILFYIYSLNKGGAERVLLTLAEKINNDENYEVVILTDAVAPNEFDLPEKVRRIHLSEFMGNKLSFGVSGIDRLIAIRKCVKNENPYKFIAFMIPSAVRAITATMFSRYKVIAAVRSNPFDSHGDRKVRNKLVNTFKKAEKVICQTEFQKEYFTKNQDISIPDENCRVIFNPIFDGFCEEPYSGEREKTIVATGRLEEFKNHKMLMRAFSKVSPDFPDVKLVIYGEGPFRSETEAARAKLPAEVQDRILLPGDSKNVKEDIKKSMIYVLSSDTEGMPNALLEALALGLPCISTDCPCGGPASLIEDGVNGLLVPIENEDTMAAAMKRLIMDSELRENLSKEAIKIREVCDANVIANKWKELLV